MQSQQQNLACIYFYHTLSWVVENRLPFMPVLANTWCQPVLIDNLAFCLCTRARPQNRPIFSSLSFIRRSTKSACDYDLPTPTCSCSYKKRWKLPQELSCFFSPKTKESVSIYSAVEISEWITRLFISGLFGFKLLKVQVLVKKTQFLEVFLTGSSDE